MADDDKIIMDKIRQFNTDIDNIILSKVPQLAEAISKSGNPN